MLQTSMAIEASEPNRKVDSSRGIYVPQGVKKRIWEGSWISQDTHIQICVRNPLSLLGVWLHDPTSLEVNDVCKALQAGGVVIDSAYPQGEEVSTEVAEGETN